MFTFVFVSAVGLVTAGLTRNLWPLLTGHDVSLSLLDERSLLMPLRAMVLVISAPVMLMGASLRHMSDAPGGLLKWWITLPAAMGWSFVQGVVVVVTLSSMS